MSKLHRDPAEEATPAAEPLQVATRPSEVVRLVSVVAVDVAGYSRLSERDQAAAARAVLGIRDAVEIVAGRHFGRVFNTAGDGLMLEFGAAEYALSAVVDLIDNPPQRAPALRIGAHLGDAFVTDGGDLLGHGVNVSARLQAIATPGTALVSADLQSAARGVAESRLRDKGRVGLAKMRQKVRVFEIAPPTVGKHVHLPLRRLAGWPAWLLLAGMAAIAVTILLRPAHIGDRGAAGPPLVAVLPFDNLGPEPNTGYFADGLSEEILDALMRGAAVRVAARSSSFQFRGEDKARAAELLGADYILDGSIRREGTHVRVTAHLSDVRRKVTVWTQTYDRDLSGALALENEIAGEVARALKLVLVAPPRKERPAAAVDPAWNPGIRAPSPISTGAWS